MNKVKRIAASISSSFDWLIGQVENHEALVDAAIADVNHSGAKAKAQLSRVVADGKSMRKRLVELKDAEEQWRERAKKAAAEDEAKALECVRRLKKVQNEAAQLEEQEREHAKMEKQLRVDLSGIEERLGQLKRQRNLMRTRQTRAEALKSLRSGDSELITEIDDIFERWESKVNEYESLACCNGESVDPLEEEFVHEEEAKDLRAALSDLLNEPKA